MPVTAPLETLAKVSMEIDKWDTCCKKRIHAYLVVQHTNKRYLRQVNEQSGK